MNSWKNLFCVQTLGLKESLPILCINKSILSFLEKGASLPFYFKWVHSATEFHVLKATFNPGRLIWGLLHIISLWNGQLDRRPCHELGSNPCQIESDLVPLIGLLIASCRVRITNRGSLDMMPTISYFATGNSDYAPKDFSERVPYIEWIKSQACWIQITEFLSSIERGGGCPLSLRFGLSH